jgi:hypothetical protein
VRHALGHLQLGDVATWVGGIATAVALILTYLLLLLTRQEQQAQRAEQRQAQARLVSAWCGTVQPASDSGLGTVTVTLQNSSHEPVYGVRVAVGTSWSANPIDYRELDLPYVIAPRYRGEHTVSLRFRSPELGPPGLGRVASGGSDVPPVEIIFTDAAGTFWRRDRLGGLTALNERLPSAAAKHFFTKPAVPAGPGSGPRRRA